MPEFWERQQEAVQVEPIGDAFIGMPTLDKALELHHDQIQGSDHSNSFDLLGAWEFVDLSHIDEVPVLFRKTADLVDPEPFAVSDGPHSSRDPKFFGKPVAQFLSEVLCVGGQNIDVRRHARRVDVSVDCMRTEERDVGVFL